MFEKNFVRRVVAVSQISILLLTFLPGSSAKVKNPLTVFSNAAPITINTATGVNAPTLASTYPSNIVVSGMTGTITKVEVTLNGVSHTNIQNLDFLLVSPTNAKYIFLSDATGQFNLAPVEDTVLKFSDTGTAFTTATGTYLPTSGDNIADTFPAPAPAGPYGQPPGATFASVFNGADPNGTWQLFAVDDTLGLAGSVNSGWVLTITTSGAPATFANPNYFEYSDIQRQATPYGSIINVSGETGVISDLNVTLTGFSHDTPDHVDILLVSPNGKGLVLMSDAGGFNTVSNVNLTFDDAAATLLPFSPVSGTYKPTDFESPDAFLTPAPLRPYHVLTNNQLSNFNGYNPNGEWRLFVVDDNQSDAGSISGGWSLDVTTVPTPPPVQPTCVAPRFSPVSNYLAGANPTNLAIADFNNDTEADVAVTNQVSNNISILLGNGDGTLGAQSLVNAGTSPYAIVAGKFDPGNNFDLAVVNSGSNNVSILLGNGDGTFGAPTNFTVGSDPISIAVGDLNNDTNQDLAVANFGGFFSGTVSILLGNGSGGFTPAANVITSTQPAFVTITNFNGDTNQDLIVANFGADEASTYIGSGTGTFQSFQTLATGSGPVAIEVANFIGGDSFADIAVAKYSGQGIQTCAGSASGMFNCSTGPSYSPNPISITSGDYLGNGTIGLAVALSGSNRVRVLTQDFTVGQNPNAVDTLDLNGDNKPDLITANAGSNDVSVLINSCQVAVGNLFDFNGDRKTDFSVFRPSNNNWFIQSLNGTGAAKIFARPGDMAVSADYDGDNINDYAFYRPESGLWHILDTNSRPIHFVQFGLPTDIPVPADYDGDGKADIAIWRPSDGNWWIRRSSDNAIQTFAFGLNGDKPVPADYDGDGTDDIAVYRPLEGTWYIFRSSDSQVYIRQFGISEDRTVAGDYDGDGSADIAVWRPSTAIWYVLESSDDDFRAVQWGLPTDVPLVGDYEGDGKFDYAVWRASDKNWYIMKSSDNGSIIFPWGLAGDVPLPSVFVR